MSEQQVDAGEQHARRDETHEEDTSLRGYRESVLGAFNTGAVKGSL